MSDVVIADFFNAIILHFLFNCTMFKYPLNRFIQADNEFQHQTSKHQTSDIVHPTSNISFPEQVHPGLATNFNIRHQNIRHQTSNTSFSINLRCVQMPV